MPVSLVKSLSSSTSAFAGSQAAQHIVSDLVCAAAGEHAAAARPPKRLAKASFPCISASSLEVRLLAAFSRPERAGYKAGGSGDARRFLRRPIRGRPSDCLLKDLL